MVNTVKKGNEFEKKSLEVVRKLLEDRQLGVFPENAVIHWQQPYYSEKRKGNIIFDLTVEIWPEGAERFVSIYFIECKDYSTKRVPIGDLEAFNSKIEQVAGANKKAILITNNSFQKSAIEYAKSMGYMLICTNGNADDDYQIIMHRKESSTAKEFKIDIMLLAKIKSALMVIPPVRISKLSSKAIEKRAITELTKFNGNSKPVDIGKLVSYLETREGLSFEFDEKLPVENGIQTLGAISFKDLKISIHKDIVNTNRLPFVLGHELGHFYLHKDLKLTQNDYDSFVDSSFSLIIGRKPLANEKDWIEWQANKFSSCFFLPKTQFIDRFLYYRKLRKIRKPEKIFLDNQRINKEDHYDTVGYLSQWFKVSNTMVKIRLEELNLITYEEGYHSFYDGLKGISIPFFE